MQERKNKNKWKIVEKKKYNYIKSIFIKIYHHVDNLQVHAKEIIGILLHVQHIKLLAFFLKH